MKLVIVGGVAGGASAAARARRLDEQAEIVMFERGEFISFANCGLPYHLSGVIPQRESLLVMTPERFKARFSVDVRIRQEVTAIHRDRKTVVVRKAETGEVYEERYDTLILATGSRPVIPPIPGADAPGVHTLWTLGDMDRILARLGQGVRRATVIGGGFIGIEVAENLRARGLEVHLVDVLPHVLRTLDAEMAQPLHQELTAKGVVLHLNQAATAIESVAPNGPLTVALQGGERLETDVVIMAVGVRPNSELGAAAGLTLSAGRAIAVDEHLRSSDPSILAVGDAIAVRDVVSGEATLIPLAGPANRQGRIAAENACGRDSRYRGTLGTSVVQVFGLTAASVGRTAEALTAAKTPFRRVYVHPLSNASYYPGAEVLHMKLLCRDDGTLLGAQVVGRKNVEKQVDVLATAMRAGLTVYDLAELELAYAPPYGSAKSPINVVGMVAANLLRGDSDAVYADALPKGALLLDVREPAETDLGLIPDARLIPLGQLRQRLGELPRDRQIVVYCKVGLRGYVAERILKQHGFQAANLSGGWVTWKHTHPGPAATPAAPLKAAPGSASTPAAPPAAPAPLKALPVTVAPVAATPPPAPERRLDVTAMQCPGPIVRVRQEIDSMQAGEVVAVQGALAFRNDLEAWCASCGHEIVALSSAATSFAAQVRKGNAPGAACALNTGAVQGVPDSATVVLFSNDLDKVMAAFIIATGMASLGTKVSMFFTFWGLSVLRKDPAPHTIKDVISAMFGFMLPRGAGRLALSKMHMLGLGTNMMKQVMARKHVSSLPELMRQARSLGVRFVACDMAMDVMGLQREELLDEVDELAGVGKFAAMARASSTTLFI
jgi:NADPH-dependent 2,4-dienoyl-CoA reductase/sulfur reductase-like enzyme/peroxiredoxin family protein/rhodanese-related sulfurtransferase/TusA-related sulfurtransferase